MTQTKASNKGLAPGDRDENPNGIGLLALLREDLRTHDDNLLAPGFWALCTHRLGNARMRIKSAPLRAPLSVAYQVAFHGVIALWGIDLPYNVRVGRRLRIERHGCLLVGARAIGDDVIIRNSVTMGLQNRHAAEFPSIGNRVEIGPGACIVGGIHVGDDAYIGPNSVVARDVRPGSAVIGIPPRCVDLAALGAPASAVMPQLEPPRSQVVLVQGASDTPAESSTLMSA
jgi:serine O-acetyltransferase